MAHDKSVPVLHLDSLSDRPTVALGDQEYELLTPDILPPIASHRLKKLGKRLETLQAKDDLTKVEEKELEALPIAMCKLLLDAPEQFVDDLSPLQRMKVLESFLGGPRIMTLLAEAQMAAAAAMMPATETSTGATSPPASAGSIQP